MRYLVDTNVFSELHMPVPEPKVTDWMFKHDAELSVSVVTLGELERGILGMKRGLRRKNFLAWFGSLQSNLQGKILPITEEIMKVWATLYAGWPKHGPELPVIDSLLAATAVQSGMTVVTRNTKDFPKSVPTLNPWER